MQTKDYSPKVIESLKLLYDEVCRFCFVNVKRLDIPKAVQGLTKCAELGYSDAYYSLGEIYFLGLDGEINLDKAKEYYLRGDMTGNVKCKYGLAKLEAEGEDKHARFANIYNALFTQALDKNDADPISRYILACYFEQGLGGCAININATVYWTSLSALSGYTLAQHKLAGYCLTGKGIEQSYEAAKEWYNKAAVGGLKIPQLETPQPKQEIADEPTQAEVLTEMQKEQPESKPVYENDYLENPPTKEPTNVEQPTEAKEPTNTEKVSEPQIPETNDNLPEVTEQSARIGEQLKDLYKEVDNFAVEQATEPPQEEPKAKEAPKFESKNAMVASLMRAAEGGDAEAQYNLAVMYEVGVDVEQNHQAAYDWYVRSAKQSYAKAQCNLGLYYELGISVEKDANVAVELYRQAAKQGYAPGEYNLGQCYLNNVGVRHSFLEAARYLQSAADKGHAAASFSLGVLYETGKGVNRDYRKAYKYFSFAANNGVTLAQAKLVDVERKLQILGAEPYEQE